MLWTVAVARLLLDPSIHLQAPPNLASDLAALVEAGIDDWGGVSPVTPDHVNPERPWPELDRLRLATEAAGKVLAPRLTVYPEYVCRPDEWLHADVRFAVQCASDGEGMAREHGWAAGGTVSPPDLLGLAGTCPGPGGPSARCWPGWSWASRSAWRRSSRCSAPGAPSWRRCARWPTTSGAGRSATSSPSSGTATSTTPTSAPSSAGSAPSPRARCRSTSGATPTSSTSRRSSGGSSRRSTCGATEVCLQGGIHPSFDGDYYLEVTRAVKAVAPNIHVHGFTALEVFEGARRLGMGLGEYLARLKSTGLATLPGTAAEILDDEVRAIICPDKVTTDEWLEVHRVAHSIGLRSNVTIMFGHVERPVHVARHLVRARALQAQTGGFTEVVPLPFVHMASPIYLQKKARPGPTFREALLIHAVSRIAMTGLIDNIQCSWVKLGLDGARQALRAGCNDLGGTLMNENISRAAGAEHGQGVEEEELAEVVAPLGRPLEQRTTLYGRVRTARPPAGPSGPVAHPGHDRPGVALTGSPTGFTRRRCPLLDGWWTVPYVPSPAKVYECPQGATEEGRRESERVRAAHTGLHRRSQRVRTDAPDPHPEGRLWATGSTPVRPRSTR